MALSRRSSSVSFVTLSKQRLLSRCICNSRTVCVMGSEMQGGCNKECFINRCFYFYLCCLNPFLHTVYFLLSSLLHKLVWPEICDTGDFMLCIRLISWQACIFFLSLLYYCCLSSFFPHLRFPSYSDELVSGFMLGEGWCWLHQLACKMQSLELRGSEVNKNKGAAFLGNRRKHRHPLAWERFSADAQSP